MQLRVIDLFILSGDWSVLLFPYHDTYSLDELLCFCVRVFRSPMPFFRHADSIKTLSTHVYVYSCCGMRCGCPTFFSNTRLFLIYCLSVNHNQKHARAIYPVRSRPLLWVLFPCSCTSNLQIRCTCTFYNSHRSLKTILEPNMSKVQCIVHSFIHSCQDNSEVWSP
jgi:hypothetical protein